MTYALDTTGLAAGNLVTGETHSVSPALLSNFGYIFPTNGPFFGNNLQVTYTPLTLAQMQAKAFFDLYVTFENNRSRKVNSIYGLTSEEYGETKD